MTNGYLHLTLVRAIARFSLAFLSNTIEVISDHLWPSLVHPRCIGQWPEVVPLLFGTGDIERHLTYTSYDLFPGKSSAKHSSEHWVCVCI